MNKSSKLFATPSFVEGIARVLDLGGTLQAYNTSATELEADEQALSRDWQIVGDDIRKSATIYEQTTVKK